MVILCWSETRDGERWDTFKEEGEGAGVEAVSVDSANRRFFGEGGEIGSGVEGFLGESVEEWRGVEAEVAAMGV